MADVQLLASLGYHIISCSVCLEQEVEREEQLLYNHHRPHLGDPHLPCPSRVLQGLTAKQSEQKPNQKLEAKKRAARPERAAR